VDKETLFLLALLMGCAVGSMASHIEIGVLAFCAIYFIPQVLGVFNKKENPPKE
jgi:hypothetical protein